MQVDRGKSYVDINELTKRTELSGEIQRFASTIEEAPQSHRVLEWNTAKESRCPFVECNIYLVKG